MITLHKSVCQMHDYGSALSTFDAHLTRKKFSHPLGTRAKTAAESMWESESERERRNVNSALGNNDPSCSFTAVESRIAASQRNRLVCVCWSVRVNRVLLWLCICEPHESPQQKTHSRFVFLDLWLSESPPATTQNKCMLDYWRNIYLKTLFTHLMLLKQKTMTFFLFSGSSCDSCAIVQAFWAVFNYYAVNCKVYCVLSVFMLYCKTLLLVLWWDTVRFKGGLRDRSKVNSVIIDVFTEINYSCNCIQVFFVFVRAL